MTGPILEKGSTTYAEHFSPDIPEHYIELTYEFSANQRDKGPFGKLREFVDKNEVERNHPAADSSSYGELPIIFGSAPFSAAEGGER